MNAPQKLQEVAEEFLENSTNLYEECITGLSDLDIIVVSVNSRISSKTRGYLLPIVYAYWERFFKTIFLEFVRCIEQANIGLDDLKPDILTYRFRKELIKIGKSNNFKELHSMADKLTLEEIREVIGEFRRQLYLPLDFPEHTEWIETNSNVDIESIRSSLEEHNLILFTGLRDLIISRNKIAHGEVFQPVSSHEWNKTKEFVTELMNVLQVTLYEHLSENHTILR